MHPQLPTAGYQKRTERKRTVVGRIYGMKHSRKGYKDINRHKNRTKNVTNSGGSIRATTTATRTTLTTTTVTRTASTINKNSDN